MLNDKQIKILTSLLNSSEPLQSSFLSERLKLSTRTVKHYIKQINEEVSEKHLAICSNTRRGYWIPETQKRPFMNVVYNNDKHSTFPSTQNRRVFYIGIHFLKYQSGTPSLQKLADEFYVSKSTISNDIAFLKEIANASGDLKLKTVKTGGITIEGSEHAMRHFFSSLVMLFYDIDSSYIKRSVMETFGAVYTATPLHDILIHSLAGQGIQLSDVQMSILTFQILFSTYRFQNGHPITGQKRIGTARPEWCTSIEKCLNVHYTEDEISYIKTQIDAVQGIHNGDIEHQRAEKAKKEWLAHVKEEYSLDLSHEEILQNYLDSLLDHGSLTADMIIHDQTIRDHPFAVALAKEMNLSLIKNSHAPLELSKMAGLSAVLTIVLDQNAPRKNTILLIDSDDGIRKYDVYRLQERFSTRMNIIGAYPLYQINDIALFKDCGMILCTSHSLLEWTTYASAVQKINKDIIFINLALSETDMHKIDQYLLSYMPSCGGGQKLDPARKIIE